MSVFFFLYLCTYIALSFSRLCCAFYYAYNLASVTGTTTVNMCEKLTSAAGSAYNLQVCATMYKCVFVRD